MPPHLVRLVVTAACLGIICYSFWRLSFGGLVGDASIGNLSGSGHFIDAHGDYVQGLVPPIHDNSHKHDYNGNLPIGTVDDDPDPGVEDNSDLAVGDGGKPKSSGSGERTVYITVTATVGNAATDVPTAVADKTDVAPADSSASAIVRDFERYHGLEEDYTKSLTDGDQKILKDIVALSTRQTRIKRMYDLDGANEWHKFLQDQDDSAMPPFTKFTQEFLYRWQHPDPSTCKDRRFLVLHHNWDGNGLGTVVHGTGWVLGLAIRLNRILVYDDAASPGKNFLEEKCSQDGLRSLDCIFEPFSSCSSTRDANGSNSIKLRSYWKIPEHIDMSTSAVPPLFGQMLRNNFPQMHTDAIKYWWRSQAAAYMMRMNGPALRRLKEFRQDAELNKAYTHNESGVAVSVPVPYPLPDGSFSMHVRHGDKGIEMELIPFRKYVDRAEEFAAMNMIMANKICFISTEDQEVLDEAKTIGNAWISPNTTSNQNWTWVWSEIPRINGGPVEQLNKFGNRTDMTIKWMQQLFFAIEAPYILGTRGSGWNRMIDELRCIWVDCRTPYMEVGPFEDWVHYNF